MNKTQAKEIGQCIERQLRHQKEILEKVKKAAIVFYPSKTTNPDEARKIVIEQRKAIIERYEQLLKEHQAGEYGSDYMQLLINFLDKKKLKVRQTKASRALEQAVISPVTTREKGEGFQAKHKAKNNELYYLQTRQPLTGTLSQECRKIMHLWNDNYTRTNSLTLEMPLSEYMEKTGITSIPHARERLEKINDALLSMRWLYRDEIPGYVRNTEMALFIGIQTLEKKPEKKPANDTETKDQKDFKALWNGKIILMGTPLLGALYSGGSFIWILTDNLSISSKTYPYAYNFYVRLCEHSTWNLGKANSNTISVKKLLESEPRFPTYKYVKEKLQRDYRKRIIEPFIENMNSIKGISWKFDREVVTYTDFIAANVKFEMLPND